MYQPLPSNVTPIHGRGMRMQLTDFEEDQQKDEDRQGQGESQRDKGRGRGRRRDGITLPGRGDNFDLIQQLQHNISAYSRGRQDLSFRTLPKVITSCSNRIMARLSRRDNISLYAVMSAALFGGIGAIGSNPQVMHLVTSYNTFYQLDTDDGNFDVAEQIETMIGVFDIGIADHGRGSGKSSFNIPDDIKNHLKSTAIDLRLRQDQLAIICMQAGLCEVELVPRRQREWFERAVGEFYENVGSRADTIDRMMTLI